MRDSHTPCYNGERRQHDHIVAAFVIATFPKYPRLPSVPRGNYRETRHDLGWNFLSGGHRDHPGRDASRASTGVGRLEDLAPQVADPLSEQVQPAIIASSPKPKRRTTQLGSSPGLFVLPSALPVPEIRSRPARGA